LEGKITLENSFLANVLEINAWVFDTQEIPRINTPANRDIWYMVPQEVNAYYDAQENVNFI
jgi:predicted metalloendopeptidase